MLLRGNDDDAVMVFGARFGGGCCGVAISFVRLCVYVCAGGCMMESDDGRKRRTNILRVW